MSCPHCGAPLKEGETVCPHCVKQEERISHNTPTGGAPWWVKLLACAIALCALFLGWRTFSSHDEIGETVQNQLKAFHDNRLTEAYYQYSSKDFEKNIPLKEFQQFAETFPVLAHNKGIIFTERSVKDNTAEVKGTLTTLENVKVPIEYTLVKENDKWKVSKIEFPKPFDEAVMEIVTDPKALRAPVEDQLKALKANEINKAYDYGSKEFKETTDLAAFNKFLERFPILTQYEALKFQAPNMDEGTLHVDLEDKNGTPTGLEYVLGLEDGQWKIWGFRVVKKTEK
jgi:hypothetical protein